MALINDYKSKKRHLSAKWGVDPGLYMYVSHVICSYLSFQLSQIMPYWVESYIWQNFGFFPILTWIVCCLVNAQSPVIMLKRNYVSYGMHLRDSFHFHYGTNKNDRAIKWCSLHWWSDVVSTVINESSRTVLECALHCNCSETETGKF